MSDNDVLNEKLLSSIALVTAISGWADQQWESREAAQDGLSDAFKAVFEEGQLNTIDIIIELCQLVHFMAGPTMETILETIEEAFEKFAQSRGLNSEDEKFKIAFIPSGPELLRAMAVNISTEDE